MGIGGPATSLLSVLHNNNFLKDTKSVIEIGAQDINRQHQSFIDDFPHKIPLRMRKIYNPKFNSPKEMYQSIGIKNYESIDVNYHAGSKFFDLNHDIQKKYGYREKFDLVTNFGTTEHIFNQFEVFRNMHNLCNKDGFIVGIVPMQGSVNHGFFNYQPILFEHLALANNYKMDLFWTIATDKFYTHNILPYNDHLIDKFKTYVRYNIIDYIPHHNEEQIGYVFKKTDNSEFVIPDQSYIGKGGTRIELSKTIPKLLNQEIYKDVKFEDYIEIYGHKGYLINFLRILFIFKNKNFSHIKNKIFQILKLK